MLKRVFGETLPLSRIFCHVINAGRLSITPYGNPYFVQSVYCNDFAAPGVEVPDQAHFIHELTHVWQYYHGVNVVREAACISRQARGRYLDAAYRYSLRAGRFAQLNIEQQASTVQDYWRLSHGEWALDSKDDNPRVEEYADALQTLRRAGPPRIPNYDFAPDFGNSDTSF